LLILDGKRFHVWKTARGKPMLVLDGFSYYKNVTQRDKIYWLCSKNRSIKCNARLVTDLEIKRVKIKSALQHNHP
jgi:hypothetical protein